ncbi:class I adenylate-forming enzyme family protein [Metabacillus sp. HB246100]
MPVPHRFNAMGDWHLPVCNSFVTSQLYNKEKLVKGVVDVMVCGDWLRKRADLSPMNVALVDGTTKEKWTYKELHEQALRWAMFFQDKGLQQGDRVVVVAQNSPIFFEMMFACQKIGCVLTPLNWRLSEAEIREIALHAEPALMVFDDFSLQAFPTLQTLGFQWEPLNRVKEKINIQEFCGLIDESKPKDHLPWLMIYTGGTTGKPKGVVITERAINWNAYNTIITWGLTEKDTTLTYMPMFHTGGINALSIPLLMAGGTVVVANKFSASEAIQLLHEYTCTIALFVPTMYHMIVEDPLFQKMPFSSMTAFLSGGAPCPHTIYEKFQQRNLPFKEGYGLTEAGPNNFSITPERAHTKVGSVGKPMLLNEVKIVNNEGLEVQTGEVGELIIKGNHMFTEYFRNEKATMEALRNGWLHTGDLAKQDHEGDYFIVGRKKEMIISGGENIYPLEIEQILIAHPNVREATIIGVKDERWGERVIAYVSVKSPEVITVSTLIEHMRPSLASYKLPKEIVILHELPKTAVGKIDKKRLVETYKIGG